MKDTKMKTRVSAFIAYMAFTLILNPSHTLADDPILLQPSNLHYIGAFRVTYVKSDEGRTGFAPARIAVSSTTNSFFINGNPYFAIAEYKIPEIINSNNLNDLAFTGKPIQAFT